jgi:PPP family 3-phenylpropionic acid transporter
MPRLTRGSGDRDGVRRQRSAGSPLARFLALYTVLFAAFGVVSPFLAAYLAAKGLSATAIGAVLAAGTAVRLVAGPVGGRLADRFGAPRLVLVCSLAASACIAYGYLPAAGFAALLAVSVAHASVLAPVTPLADALAVADAQPDRFSYGRVRGAGSAAFILGTLASGQVVARFGLGSVIWANGALLAAAAWCATRLPDCLRPAHRQAVPHGGIAALLRIPLFRRTLIAAALIQGSHAFHDGFAVIAWTHAGVGSGMAGLLWSESVAAEVVVFLFLGRPLIDRLTPAGACVLSAAGGVIRWAVLASSSSVAAAALAEPLHGLTFALQHLVCMRLIAASVPSGMAASAQALYGTAAVGAFYAVLTLASGSLYAALGPGGFWAMAALCAAAVPVAATLRIQPAAVSSRSVIAPPPVRPERTGT